MIQSIAAGTMKYGSRQGVREAALYVSSAALTALVMFRALALNAANLSLPLAYNSDAITNALQIDTLVETGWYEYQPNLGAPAGQFFSDFSVADNLGLFFAKLLSVFTSEWPVILNLIFFAGFLAAAVAAVWFLRLLRVSRTFSLVLSVLYAIAPYHFYRGENHLWLSGYFVIPLAMGLVYKAFVGGPLWGCNPRWAGWRGWLTGPTATTLLIAFAVASTNPYYGLFAVLFLAFAGMARWITSRKGTNLFGVAGAATAVVLVMFANIVPDLQYGWENESNAAAVLRTPGGTEVYSLKLAALLLPVPDHRFSLFSSIRAFYETLFPLPSESPALGLVGAGGLVALLVLALLYIGGYRGAVTDPSSAHSRLRILSALVVFGLLMSTVGGFSTLIGFFTSSLRGWNRMSIVIALFALAAVGILLDALVRKALVNRRLLSGFAKSGIAFALALALLGGGYYDQVPRTAAPDYEGNAMEFRSDQAFVDSISETVGSDSMIVQLPYREYPESGSDFGVPDSDQLKFSLHSHTLKWTGGGIKGRPLSEWVRILERLPSKSIVGAAVAANFSGVTVDRRSYEDSGAKVIAGLRDVLGEPSFFSRDNRYVFFDLTTAKAAVASQFSSASQRASVGGAVVNPVSARLDPLVGLTTTGTDLLKPYAPRLQIDNPRDSSVDVEMFLQLSYAFTASTLLFSYEDGTAEEVDVKPGLNDISLRIQAAPGRSHVVISLVEGQEWPKYTSNVMSTGAVEVADVKLMRLLGLENEVVKPLPVPEKE